MFPYVDIQDYYTVILNYSKPHTVKKRLRCNDCGMVVFEYFAALEIIVEGKLYPTSVTLDVMCKKCKVIYRIGFRDGKSL